MKNTNGFTLLEVMIVLVIMATLAIFSVETIQNSIREKRKIQSTIDEVSRLRDALRIVERDINLAFHYLDFEMEMLALIKEKKKALKTSTTLQRGQIPAPPTTSPPPGFPLQPGMPGYEDPNDPLNVKRPNRVDPVTHFLGKESELYFATMNTGRVSEDVLQADFIKVGYLLTTCKKPGDTGEASQCLVRKSSPVVEGKIEEGGTEIVLVENIREFKLRYFGQGKQDWVSNWNTKENDGATKDKFPDAVEISLKTGDKAKKQKEYSLQLVVPIRFPNNPVPKPSATAPPST
jgi:prepilin-type N-terminal cleavage/methylation domain-containing protein